LNDRAAAWIWEKNEVSDHGDFIPSYSKGGDKLKEVVLNFSECIENDCDIDRKSISKIGDLP